MLPAKIDGKTRPIGKPEDWKESSGHCATIHVRDERIGELKFMKSAWEPDALEAGWMLAGARIHLGISAVQHPVVNLGIGPTPAEFDAVYTIKPMPDPQGRSMVRLTRFGPRKDGLAVYADAEVVGGDLAEAFARALEAIEAYAA